MLDKILHQSAQYLLASFNKITPSDILVFSDSERDVEMLKGLFPSSSIAVFEFDSLPARGTYDLIFSNNYFPHLPSHTDLIQRLMGLLNAGGLLAVQTPNALNMPIHVIMESIAGGRKWKRYFMGLTANYFVPSYYYEVLCNLSDEIDLWETNHQHVFSQHQEILDLYTETEMKVYLDRIPNDELRDKFKKKILELLPADYKKQTNQAILFPYRRTYFTAIKK